MHGAFATTLHKAHLEGVSAEVPAYIMPDGTSVHREHPLASGISLVTMQHRQHGVCSAIGAFNKMPHSAWATPPQGEAHSRGLAKPLTWGILPPPTSLSQLYNANTCGVVRSQRTDWNTRDLRPGKGKGGQCKGAWRERKGKQAKDSKIHELLRSR